MSDRIEDNGGVGANTSNGTPGAGQSGSPRPLQPRRPVGVVIGSAIEGARTLVRKQLELARIEMTEAVSVRAKGAGMMAAAAVLGLFALGFAAASG